MDIEQQVDGLQSMVMQMKDKLEKYTWLGTRREWKPRYLVLKEGVN